MYLLFLFSFRVQVPMECLLQWFENPSPGFICTVVVRRYSLSIKDRPVKFSIVSDSGRVFVGMLVNIEAYIM